jgi:hypothetical protein
MLRLKLFGGEGEAKGKDDGAAENRAGLKRKARPCNGNRKVKNAGRLPALREGKIALANRVATIAIPSPTSESDAPVSPLLRPSEPA